MIQSNSLQSLGVITFIPGVWHVSMVSHPLRSHDSSYTHDKRDQAFHKRSKLNFCLFLCVKSYRLTLSIAFHSSEVLSFSFALTSCSFHEVPGEGSFSFTFLTSFEVSCAFQCSCLLAQVLNAQNSRCACSWCTAPGWTENWPEYGTSNEGDANAFESETSWPDDRYVGNCPLHWLVVWWLGLNFFGWWLVLGSSLDFITTSISG